MTLHVSKLKPSVLISVPVKKVIRCVTALANVLNPFSPILYRQNLTFVDDFIENGSQFNCRNLHVLLETE